MREWLAPQSGSRFLITQDLDFSDIRKFAPGTHHGLLLVQTTYYNLDVIISVGYRVKSPRGTQFRVRATQRLREYIVKGFTLDDEQLKQGGSGKEYYDELLHLENERLAHHTQKWYN